MFTNRNAGKTLVTRTQGTKVRSGSTCNNIFMYRQGLEPSSWGLAISGEQLMNDIMCTLGGYQRGWLAERLTRALVACVCLLVCADCL